MRVVVAVVTLLVLDALWIVGVMRRPYAEMVRRVQGGRAMSVRAAPAVVAYACMILGLRTFVLDAERMGWSVARGMVFGMVTYGVYHGTCASLLQDWDVSVAVMDVLWGGALYGVAAASAFV